MSLDEKITSPHRRTAHAVFSASPSYKKQHPRGGNESSGSCSTVIQRHRFLLTAMGLLAFICTVYLYFAVTLGSHDSSCSGLAPTERAACLLERRAVSQAKGKLKF